MFKFFKLDQTVLNERVWWSTAIQQNQTHPTLDGKYVYLIYWSSVKAVKVILILVSFNISILGVNSKINILCENVNIFVYQGEIF